MWRETFCAVFVTTGLAAQTPTTRQQPDLDQVDPLVQPLLAGKLAVGLTVGILQDGATKVRGYGRIAKDRPERPNAATVYEIGSITKVFTGILLADAVTRGLVSLDDPLQKHVPETVVVPKFGNPPIRLVHLSTHTSALPRLPGNLAPANPTDPYADYTAERLYAALAATKLDREPGTKYAYSNFAAGLLGHVLQTLAKSPSYEHLLVERICKPLGLDDTRVTLTESMRERLAPPYNDAGQQQSNWTFDALAGAGALRSTTIDMLRFAAANLEPSESQQSGTLASALALARTKQHEPGFAARLSGQPTLGLGWHFAKDRSIIWHNGGTGGYRTHLRIDTKRQLAVVVLANTTSERIDELAAQIHDVLAGKKVRPMQVPIPVAVAAKILQSYVGRYELTPTMTFDITLDEGVLSAQLTGQPALPIFPSSSTRFRYRAVVAEIEFKVENGVVTGLVLYQNGREMPATRLADKHP